MPVIALFFGIRVTMYWDEHGPAHFHAEYADHKAAIDIREGVVLRGFLPRRQLKLVLAWAELHTDDLMENWELARDGRPLRSLEGLR
jgi:hypothetical protein